jgi:deoxyribodipyrimidine photolyase
MAIDLAGVMSGIVFIISAIVWFTRLESRVNFLKENLNNFEKDLLEQKLKIDNVEDKIVNKLSDIEKSLSWIQGNLEIKKEDI